MERAIRTFPAPWLRAAALGLCALLAGCHPLPATRPSTTTAVPGSGTTDARLADPWFAAGRREVALASRELAEERRARNVILFVGDGMGLSTVTAARILEGQRRGGSGEGHRLAFEELPHTAFSKTYNTDAQVSDSASTITAMLSGVKTKTGVIGVRETVRRGDPGSVPGARIVTLLEEAEDRGLATGLVTTTTLTHATPAGAYAHVPLRFWEDDSRLPASARANGFPDIARQLLENPHGDGVDVALGGGRRHFRPQGAADPEHPETTGSRLDGRDLTREWSVGRPGSVYVWHGAQLAGIDPATTRRLLGLFEPGHMRFELERADDTAGEPSLAELTATAIDLLERDEDGFFLMVEGGRIDHAHHATNAARALVETIALSDAVRIARERTNPEETLIVVTADHSHTLTLSGYPVRGNPILGKVVALDWLGGESRLAEDALGLPYTTLSYANGPGYTGASADQPAGPHAWSHAPCERRPPFDCTFQGIRSGRPDLRDVDTRSPDYLQETTVPLGAETHAGEDVPVYAGGPRAALFHGVREQHYLYHAMVEALGWTRGGEPVD